MAPPTDGNEQNDWFRVLADAMPHLVWTADANGVVDYYNSRAAHYGGIVVFEDTYDWQPLVHPDELDATLAAWSEAAEAGTAYEYRHRILMADGTYRWHLSRAVPVVDAEHGVVKWFGTATDVHDRTVDEHQLAEAVHVLQSALLPRTLPSSDWYQLAARYQPASTRAQVGGDWFDAVATERDLTLVIGDVAGHGLEAAAVMGAARHALATAALSGDPPNEALEVASRYLMSLTETHVTCLVARIEFAPRQLTVASAGHPPPIVVVDGRTTLQPLTPGPPLGIAGRPYPVTSVTCPDDLTLVMFTDGLVERRSHDLERGLATLAARTAAVMAEGEPTVDELCDRLIGDFATDAEDDVAVLVGRLDGRSRRPSLA